MTAAALAFCPRCGNVVGLFHSRPECDAIYAARFAAAAIEADANRSWDAVEDAVDLLDFRTGKGNPGPIDPAMRDIVDRLRAALKVGA